MHVLGLLPNPIKKLVEKSAVVGSKKTANSSKRLSITATGSTVSRKKNKRSKELENSQLAYKKHSEHWSRAINKALSSSSLKLKAWKTKSQSEAVNDLLKSKSHFRKLNMSIKDKQTSYSKFCGQDL